MARTLKIDDRRWVDNKRDAFAGWRGWKYRSVSFYAVGPPPKHIDKPGYNK